MNAYGLKRDNLYVNSSIDTLFEACAASGGRVIAGHNVITAGFVAPGTDNFLGLLDRIAARLAVRRIIATTDYQKQIYSELGIPEQTITVIPSCLDMSSVHDLLRATEGHSGNDGKPVIFYGGRMEPDKGIRELLLAYRELVKTVPATLKLLGDGSLRAWVYRMKQRIEQESNNASVSFSGRWESREVVLREMSNADVVVLPSYHEMCPVSLIEAMCLSKAAVCTAVGGPKRMVTSQVDGLLVRPFQVTELLEAISALLLDASLRRKLGTNAFETFKRSYDVSVVAPKFKHFLENS